MSEALNCPAAPVETPERILQEVQMTALLRVLGRKKGEALLRAMTADLASRVEFTAVEPIRMDRAAVHVIRSATHEAAALFNREIPRLLAALPARR